MDSSVDSFYVWYNYCMLSLLREWLTINRPLIFFVYGQVFFVVGLAIALQSWRHSRLPLARTLPWLAGFGFLHGFHEWGDLFLPIQEPFLPPPLFNLLYAFQLLLLATSFASLYQFGVELLSPWPPARRWMRFLPAFTLLLWLIGSFWFGLVLISEPSQWHAIADALARYFLGFPGGLVAGYGLFRRAQEQVHPLGQGRTEAMLRLAAVALLVYAFFGGLVVPAAPFFPANWLNAENFSRLFIVPPPVFRSLAGLSLAAAIIRALEVFDLEVERMIRNMEETQIIAAERERLARDLHDGALQQIYAAGLLAQTLQKQADGSLKEGLERLLNVINQGIEQLRRFLAQEQIEIQTVELIPALEAILSETRRLIPVEAHWQIPTSFSLTPEQVNHLIAFTREALSNAIRHAQTDRIEVKLDFAEERLRLTIRDFGRGLPKDLEPGYGLRNMRDRVRLLGAELYIQSQTGKGTTLILELPHGAVQ